MKVRKKILQTTLVMMILVQLLSAVVKVYAPTFPIGDSLLPQSNGVDSNPTAGSSVGAPVGLVGTDLNARDGSLDTNVNWRIGGAGTGVTVGVQVDTFENTSVAFTIGWVDIKVDYGVPTATVDDVYRIVYNVAPEPLTTWHELQPNSTAVFPAGFSPQHGPRTFSNVTEPNDGVWTWTDIGNLRVRVESQRVGATEDGTPLGRRFNLYEVWLTVYEGSYPPDGNLSIQPSVISGLVTNDIFYVDVYATNVTTMHGFQFLIFYDTTVLTAFEYFTYTPFLLQSPSEINDDPYGNGTGYVALAYTSYLGDPNGFTGDTPLARIYFFVDASGISLIHIQDSILSDIGGFRISHTRNDAVFATSAVRNVAVTDVAVNATEVLPGGVMQINVTVMNQGGNNESSIEVAAFFNSSQVGSNQTISLAPAVSRVVTFNWNTTGVPMGAYQIKGVAATVPPPDETTLTDNTRLLPNVVIIGRHDIAITELLRAYPTIDVAFLPETTNLKVNQSEIVYINVTVANLGTFTETFNLTVFYIAQEEVGARTLGTQTNVAIAGGTNLNYTYTFDTSNVKFDPLRRSPDGILVYDNLTFCQVKAAINYVPYESGVGYDHRADNLRTDGTVNVTRIGPSAYFAPIGSTEVFVGEPATLDAQLSQSDPLNVTRIVSYDWDFGDGNLTSATTTLMKHAYTAAGKYQVKLTVTNNISLSSSYMYPFNITVYMRDLMISNVVPSKTTAVINEIVNITVTVKNLSPRDEYTANVTIFYNNTRIRNMNVTAYYGAALFGTFNSSLVNFNVGANSSATNTTTLIYWWNTSGLSRGSYIIKAVVSPHPVGTGTQTYESNTANNNYTSSSTVSLFNAPTVAFSFVPVKPLVTQPVAFDASASSDLDGTIASYKWDFGDGNTTTVTSSAVRHAYAVKGKYTVNLTVTDNEGFARSLVQNVTVYIRDLSVFSVEASPTSVTAGDNVTISVTVRNEGESADSFEVVVMASRDGGPDEDIDFANVTNLAPGGFTTVTFNWDTSGWAAGAYTIKGSADSNYDSDTSDNLGVGNVVNIAAATNWLLYGAVAAVVIVAVALGLLYFFKLRKK